MSCHSRFPRIIEYTVIAFFIVFYPIFPGISVLSAAPVHTTYHWHLQQPVYWPDRIGALPNSYEKAYDSALRKEHGEEYPQNDLEEIFGKDDRIAVYQYRVRDAIATIEQPDGGAQVSYTGCLVENVESLASHWKYGYYPGWQYSFREARSWTTSGGLPKLDLVVFPFHHCLAPLVDSNTLRKEIQLYRALYPNAWGDSPGISSGFFPPELAFSERIIPVLAEEGISWTFVSNSHLSRACANFPLVLGSAGEMCDPPNRADGLNPAQDNWFGEYIDRGCTPVNAYPFAYQAHHARWVDPYTGEESRVTVVPVAAAMSWRDGYSRYGVEDIDEIAWANDPENPMIVVLGHDGDNAYGGGYSYYMENVRDFCSEAAGAGYEPTVVREFLQDHPVPAEYVAHVEDGAWVNADGDFGSPAFWNWNWPLVDASGDVDISGGWSLDERNWAVITAAQNRVETAEQIAGGVDITAILDPYHHGAGDAELAWHFFLPSVTSGYMYYGASLDMEVKPSLACNNAVEHADAVIGDGSEDATPPTVWTPQRYPYNPGGTGFGSLYGYREVEHDRDLWVWTFVYDVSGVDSVRLFYRIDGDGLNSPWNDENETFGGGGGVGSWRSLPMTRREFPAENVFGIPEIDFFIMPYYIADEYYVHLTDPDVVDEGGVLLDYFIRARDTKGYEKRSDIFHVYVGAGGSGQDDPVFWIPEDPVAGDTLRIYYDPVKGALPDDTGTVFIHIGHSGWQEVLDPDPAMIYDEPTGYHVYGYASPSHATSVDFVFTDGLGNWDNNEGQDWHVPLLPACESPFVMDGAPDSLARTIAVNDWMTLRIAFDRKSNFIYVATDAADETSDHFVFVVADPGSLVQAPWDKSGMVVKWDAYLADEGMSSFSGWFGLPDDVHNDAASLSGEGCVVEGCFNVVELYGYRPEALFIASAAYGTLDGEALRWHVPGSGPPGNGDLEAGELFRFSLLSDIVPHPVGLCDSDVVRERSEGNTIAQGACSRSSPGSSDYRRIF